MSEWVLSTRLSDIAGALTPNVSISLQVTSEEWDQSEAFQLQAMGQIHSGNDLCLDPGAPLKQANWPTFLLCFQ